MTVALEGGEWSAALPGRTLPPGKTRYPFYRRLGGPQGRSGRAENFVPTGIRSQTAIPTELTGPQHWMDCTIQGSRWPPAQESSATVVSVTPAGGSIHTNISSIHDIPQGAFGYETLSDKRYVNDNRSLLKTIQDTTDNCVKYYIHNILILIFRGPN